MLTEAGRGAGLAILFGNILDTNPRMPGDRIQVQRI